MISLSRKTEILKSLGQPGGIATLDAGGKVELTQAPPALINSFFESTESLQANIQAVLTAMNSAYKGDIVSFTVLGQSYMLGNNPYSTWANWKELKTTAASLNGKTEAQLRDTFIPVGFHYTEAPDSTGFNHKLPGDTLKNYDGSAATYSDLGFASQGNYDTAKTGCAYVGTTWKLSIQPGDFTRQAGTRADHNSKTIGKAFGVKTEHQIQGHHHSVNFDYGLMASGSNYGALAGGNMVKNAAVETAVTDGTNGAIVTKGVETIPSNTAVREWVRTA